MSKWFVLMALFFCGACGEKKPDAAVGDEGAETPALPDGFAEFYRQFHEDSTYQAAHIIFPLEGLPDQADSATIAADTFRWQAADWRMQKQFDFELSEYQRDLVAVTDELVIERIAHRNGQFGMVRRFAVVGGEWHLIYYAGMNRLVE